MKVQQFLSGAALATGCLCLPQIAAARSNTAILSGIESPLTLKNTTVYASTYQLADRGHGRGGDDGDHDNSGPAGAGMGSKKAGSGTNESEALQVDPQNSSDEIWCAAHSTRRAISRQSNWP